MEGQCQVKKVEREQWVFKMKNLKRWKYPIMSYPNLKNMKISYNDILLNYFMSKKLICYS